MKRKHVPEYNYRESLKKENQKIYRRIALIITTTLVVLLIIWFMGTSFLNALSIFSKGNTQSSTPKQQDQSLPLLTPKIDPPLPDTTNQTSIRVTGETTASIRVTLTVNDKKISEKTTDTNGNFIFDNVALTQGLNLIKVTATENNESQDTSATISLDTTKPPLTITNPTDGTSYPATTNTITITGSTEQNATIRVNGSQAIVDNNGNFSYSLQVNPGSNPIQVDATDSAGNVQTVKIAITVASQ